MVSWKYMQKNSRKKMPFNRCLIDFLLRQQLLLIDLDLVRYLHSHADSCSSGRREKKTLS